jgi:hypothetical protein
MLLSALALFIAGITVLSMEVKTHGLPHVYEHVILNQHSKEFHDDGKDCEYGDSGSKKGSQ